MGRRILILIPILLLMFNVVVNALINIEAPIEVCTYGNVTVNYLRGLFSEQVFRVIIRDSLNGAYSVVVTIYVWMPNREVKELGTYLGDAGVVYINATKLLTAFKEWRDYLLNKGCNLNLINIGVIILASIHTPQGVYAIIKTVPLNLAKILGGL
ncbi:MAG: hypothetical protein B6U85_08910 [Desulfurococcales archaeon ex4484_42]|nr:MAG: hypothetical protein B6U85_08910 [Desulfurococcales archaeon ex4484_42]